MKREDVIEIIDLRANLIKIYKELPGKNEPSALVKSQDIARQLSFVIVKLDKLLAGKVNFQSQESK